jgi:hypothetical protein
MVVLIVVVGTVNEQFRDIDESLPDMMNLKKT